MTIDYVLCKESADFSGKSGVLGLLKPGSLGLRRWIFPATGLVLQRQFKEG